MPHGMNVEGLKRRGFDSETISALRQAYKILYKEGLSFEDAKLALKKYATSGLEGNALSEQASEKVNIFLNFIANSSRGIIR